MESYDSVQIYCARLGHYVQFKYCRTVNSSLPCHKIMDCAFEKIPIKEYLTKNYSAAEIETALTPPAGKISSLIDLIARAKKGIE